MTRFTVVAIALVLVLGGAVLSAQDPAGQGGRGRGDGQGRGGGRGAAAAQPAPTNLQVLPKDWTRQQVVQVMQQFNQALGVQCNHCHVFIAANDPMNDFASDKKPEKNIARAMMRMTREINPMIQKAVVAKKAAADQVTQVNCMTCHRGAAIPEVPPAPGRGPAGAPPAAPGQPPGPPGAGRGNP
jgi:hypothetical protein